MIFGPHHPLDIEPDPARFGRGERREGLGIAREQPAAEGAQLPLLGDETELDRREPQPSEEVRGAQLFGAPPRPGISDQEFRKSGVGEHRDMSEYVVNQVGSLAVAERSGGAQTIRREKSRLGTK